MTTTIQSKVNIWRIIREYLLMGLGCFCYAFAWVSIIESANGIGGGASGLALLIQYATDGRLSMGVMFFVINTVLIILAMIMIGVKFGAKTIYCIIMISVLMSFLKGILPPNLLGLGDDKLLSAVLGGALSGVGVSLCFMQGGSTGGTDIVAMIINKFKTISYGKVLLMTDSLIITGSYLIYQDIPTIIYGFIMVATFGYAVDSIMAGNNQSSQIFIFTKHYNEISERIINDMHRGVTILEGEGAYTHQPSKMLMVVCRKMESNSILRLAKEIDPDAFISVGSVMGVYGKGFEQLQPKPSKKK